MSNSTTETIRIPIENFDKCDNQNLTIVNPIEFITKEENEHIMKVVIQRAKDINDPTKWISWEDFEKEEKANGFA